MFLCHNVKIRIPFKDLKLITRSYILYSVKIMSFGGIFQQFKTVFKASAV